MRSAEFFNCNPNLAGLALGATARAEYEAVPGAQIARLRTALCSPLGALGDELFWAGTRAGARGAGAGGRRRSARGWWAVVGLLRALQRCCRFATAVWALRTGLDAGMRVGARDQRVVDPARGGAHRAGAAGAVRRPRDPAGRRLAICAASAGPACVGALAVAAVGAAVTRWSGPALTSVRFALLAMALLFFFRWVGL